LEERINHFTTIKSDVEAKFQIDQEKWVVAVIRFSQELFIIQVPYR